MLNTTCHFNGNITLFQWKSRPKHMPSAPFLFSLCFVSFTTKRAIVCSKYILSERLPLPFRQFITWFFSLVFGRVRHCARFSQHVQSMFMCFACRQINAPVWRTLLVYLWFKLLQKQTKNDYVPLKIAPKFPRAIFKCKYIFMPILNGNRRTHDSIWRICGTKLPLSHTHNGNYNNLSTISNSRWFFCLQSFDW